MGAQTRVIAISQPIVGRKEEKKKGILAGPFSQESRQKGGSFREGRKRKRPPPSLSLLIPPKKGIFLLFSSGIVRRVWSVGWGLEPQLPRIPGGPRFAEERRAESQEISSKVHSVIVSKQRQTSRLCYPRRPTAPEKPDPWQERRGGEGRGGRGLKYDIGAPSSSPFLCRDRAHAPPPPPPPPSVTAANKFGPFPSPVGGGKRDIGSEGRRGEKRPDCNRKGNK